MTKPATNEVAALARALLESAYKELLAGDLDLARASAREALEHARNTRAYAQGGSIANVLEPARQKLAEALQALRPNPPCSCYPLAAQVDISITLVISYGP